MLIDHEQVDYGKINELNMTKTEVKGDSRRNRCIIKIWKGFRKAFATLSNTFEMRSKFRNLK